MNPQTLNVGDKVAHIMLGDGVITSIQNDGVHVTFKNWRRDGTRVTGIYNEDWFRSNPRYFFRRTTIGMEG